MASDNRQAGIEFRGIALPEGMSVACAEELTKLFSSYEREEFGGLAENAAVRAFQVVRLHLLKTDLEKSN